MSSFQFSTLEALNAHLRTRSYVSGFKPSQSDRTVFQQVANEVDAKTYPYVARWYAHIASFTVQQRSAFEGVVTETKGETVVTETKPVDEEDDMFGDVDEEDAAELERELKAAKAQAELAAKRAGKKKEVAKSTIVFDVKPVELETDMAELEKRVRSIEQDGLLWGTSKLVDVAFGIKKLVITLVVEDEKVSVDDVQEKIEAFDEFVQSTEIVAFNKI